MSTKLNNFQNYQINNMQKDGNTYSCLKTRDRDESRSLQMSEYIMHSTKARTSKGCHIIRAGPRGYGYGGGGHQKPKAFTERRKPREGGEHERGV